MKIAAAVHTFQHDIKQEKQLSLNVCFAFMFVQT